MSARWQRGLALVTASLPQVCAVCGNTRNVHLVSYGDLHDVGNVNCPHCNNHGLPVPILTLPMRHDQPKDVA